MPKLDLGGVKATPAVKPPPFDPSPQQEAVFSYAKSGEGNAVIEAVAGSGKTSTLVEMCKHIQGQGVFTAFNKKISDEIGRKMVDNGVGNNIKSATMHSLGFGAWRKAVGSPEVDGEKVYRLMDAVDTPKHLRSFVKTLVSLLKQEVVMPDSADLWPIAEELIEHHDLTEKLTAEDYGSQKQSEEDLVLQGIETAQEILAESFRRDEDLIDFDDMIYAPLAHGAKFWQYDWVLIDEAQDTNRARRLLAEAMLKKSGRLVAVGDPRQAIYGFTGADADALDLIVEGFRCQRLPLTVSFRCAKAIVRHAQNWVSHIEAAPNAPEGIVRYLDNSKFMQQVPERTDAIICRNTKPLIQLAFHYLRQQIPAHVEGRDIGQSLISLVRKWRRPKTVLDLSLQLDEYRKDETYRLVTAGKESKVAQLHDRVDSLMVIMDSLGPRDPVYAVEQQINKIFKDTDGKPVQSITLSTVHKAKGREWNRVYLYGRNVMMPSPFARQPWQIEQENNLIYVAVTRAKTELIEVDL